MSHADHEMGCLANGSAVYYLVLVLVLVGFSILSEEILHCGTWIPGFVSKRGNFPKLQLTVFFSASTV